MRVRVVLLTLGALLLCAAHPPPPKQLDQYMEDGHFHPGDYGWLRGRFGDATPADQAAWLTIANWQNECIEDAMTDLRQELAQRGFPDPPLVGVSTAPLLCAETFLALRSIHRMSYEAFTAELAQARPAIASYLFAVRIAEETNGARRADLAELLERRILGEQMLRKGVFWDEGPTAGAPVLTPMGRIIVQDQLGREMTRRDYANTEWLKGVVAADGWPLISEVGAGAASAAFLLVQHADHDPVFQLDTLRLMEPLVAQDEVAPHSYAYLYDRIMLKLTGQQRYGTQAICQDGQFQPRPLEDAANIDDLRREVSLSPLSEYLAMMGEHSRSCSAVPQG